MGIDWELAGSVILSGLVIVFILLGLLIMVVVITSRIINGAGKPTEGQAQKGAPQAAMTAAPPSAATPVAVGAGAGGETVAAISAAVYAYMDAVSPGSAYKIVSISRASGSRPVWGFAGMQQNTRPF